MIGGSVGGLFAAHLLRATGWDAKIFERVAGDLGDRGTGIGTREELFAVMRRIGVPVEPSIGVDVRGRLGLDRDGNVIHELPVPAVTSAWSRIWRPLRSMLPDDCYAGSKSLRRIELRADGVTTIFEDGSRVDGDLLIGADGLHSAVRAQMQPREAPRYAGYIAWRGVVDPDRLPPATREMALHHMLFGTLDGELMLSIPMPPPQGIGRTCHFVWFRPASEQALTGLCIDAQGRRHGTSIPPPLIRPELIAAVKRDAGALLAPQLAQLVDACRQIILQPIYDLECPRMAFDRVALLGDAAFVARPHVASGVMKAAVDAESLAEGLKAGGTIAEGLERYNTTRQPYGAALVARGRHIGRAITDRAGDLQQRIETLMREYGSAGIVDRKPIAARS